MFGFMVSIIFGAVQMYATILLISIIRNRDYKVAIKFLAAKFAAYLFVTAFVMIKYLSRSTYYFSGLIVGVALSAVAFCIYKIFFRNK